MTRTRARSRLTITSVHIELYLIWTMLSISVHSYVLGHAPLKPSPLTLCNPYACQYSPSMAPFTKVASKATNHKQRAKSRSLLLQRGGEQDRRRQVFLTKVKRNGDDRRWDSRADQVPHTLSMSDTVWLTVCI